MLLQIQEYLQNKDNNAATKNELSEKLEIDEEFVEYLLQDLLRRNMITVEHINSTVNKQTKNISKKNVVIDDICCHHCPFTNWHCSKNKEKNINNNKYCDSNDFVIRWIFT